MLNHKRIMSLVLAGAMAASLAVPAFAAETTEEKKDDSANNQTKITATYEAVTIDVDVPTTGTIQINPYGLPVSIGKDADDKDVKVQEQIANKPLTLKNKSEVDLNVSASVTTAINSGSDMTLATAALSSTDTAKKAFVYLDIVGTTLAGAKDDDAVADAAITAAYGKQTWTTYSETATNVVVLSASKAVSKSDMVTLTKATMDADSGEFSEYQSGSIAFFRLNGNVVQSPKTAWATTDGFTATIAFTFIPNTTAATK
jgi:hypothetical protein